MIKPLFSLLGILAMVQMAHAQKLELSGGVSGNLTNYGGTAARSNVDAYSSPTYSKKLTGGYGLNLQAKIVASDGFILGLQTGYDELRSTANINNYGIVIDLNLAPYYVTQPLQPTYGHSTSKSKYLNLAPLIGYRLTEKKYSVDFTLGANFAFDVEDKQDHVFTSQYFNNNSFYYDKSQKTDIRVKTAIGLNYHRYGLEFAYEHGINNLLATQTNTGYYGYNPGSAFSQVLRLGISYRLF